MAAQDISVACRAFIAKRACNATAASYAEKIVALFVLLQELDFKLVPWDGKSGQAIVDRNDLVIVYLAGAPTDPSWARTVGEAGQEMQDIAKEYGVPVEASKHAPYMVGTRELPTVSLCLSWNPAFIRLAGFASSTFCIAAPCVFNHYNAVVSAVEASQPGLSKLFKNSVYPTAVFNFGPKAVTFPH
ncbi:hypothetical protein BV25DRAFT_1920827 [Artomyces pyxidatus]|uniref:Uncharacterized protein n=1 Tax=Artomyces pyxidatus TaxID=48021 RepID=A0ACB8SLE3_9AGAM|nr:hypothetical protein BV25DRAFT_1920827 [Artomyces pyxidatus]